MGNVEVGGEEVSPNVSLEVRFDEVATVEGDGGRQQS